LLKLHELAEEYDTHLAVVFSPFPYENVESAQLIQSQLNALDDLHANLSIPVDFITTSPHHIFGDNIHLTPEGSIEESRRIGKMLGQLVQQLPN
jgi:hypothetical protein